MNNSDLAEALATSASLTKAEARKYVDAVFSLVAEAAAKGEEVSLSGFGKFKIKDSPAREGRNPSTGAVIAIPASRKLAPRFFPAQAPSPRAEMRFVAARSLLRWPTG